MAADARNPLTDERATAPPSQTGAGQARADHARADHARAAQAQTGRAGAGRTQVDPPQADWTQAGQEAGPARAVRATELPDGTSTATAQPAPEPTFLPDAALPLDAAPRVLTAHGCWYPSVDPGGRNVAFICDRAGVPQLWAGPVDGGAIHLLDTDPHPVTEVAWSPDGRWIAYTTAPGGGEHTRVLCVRPDGTGRRILAGGEAGSSAHLGCWTHDGSFVAVTVAEAPSAIPPSGTEPGPGRVDLGLPGVPATPPREGWAARDGHATLLDAPPPPPRGSAAVPGNARASSAEPPPRTLSAYLVDPDGAAAPVLLASEREAATLRVCDLSRDGRLALLRRGPRGRREALVVRTLDLRVTAAVPVADGDPWIGGFSPDGRTLWLRSDHRREFAALYAVRLGRRGQRLALTVAAEREDSGLELLTLDRDGRGAVLAWNVRGVSELTVATLLPAAPASPADMAGAARPDGPAGAPDLGGTARLPGPAGPVGRPRTLSAVQAPHSVGPAGTVGVLGAPRAPGVPDVDAPGVPVRAADTAAVGSLRVVPLPHEVVTRVAVAAEPDAPVAALSGSQRRPGVWWLPQGAALRTPWSSRDEDVAPGAHSPVRPVPVRPVARDGLGLGGWYYRAPGRAPGEPAPCVLHLHGGPEFQERPVFDPLYHEVLGRGLDVFAPDVRGSSGYGRSFVDADLGRGRFAAIDDVADCAAHVVLAGLADPRRLAVMGHSYGGYLVFASLVWHPDLFRTGVAVCGMSDFATFFAGTEPWIARSAAHKYGHPDRDRELLHALSPMSRIDALRVPVLAVHGEHDTNVPPGESEQFVRAARERGVEADMLVMRDEGHYFRRADNRRAFRRAAADWIQRQLTG